MEVVKQSVKGYVTSDYVFGAISLFILLIGAVNIADNYYAFKSQYPGIVQGLWLLLCGFSCLHAVHMGRLERRISDLEKKLTENSASHN